MIKVLLSARHLMLKTRLDFMMLPTHDLLRLDSIYFYNPEKFPNSLHYDIFYEWWQFNKKVDQLIPLFEEKVEVFKEKLEELIENFDEKYLISPSEHNNLGLIFCAIVFFIFIYHFILKKQTRFVVFKLKRLKLTQKQVGERVDQLFTGFNISLVLIVLYSLCIQSLSYQTVMDSLDPLFMIIILKIWVVCGCVLLLLRTLFQWFSVQTDEALFFFVHLANSYLLPLITLVTNLRVFVQSVLHLVFPGKSIPPGIGSGSLSLGIVFYLACFTFLQTHTTELFLDVLVSGTPDMSNLFLTNNDMIVGQNELLDLMPLLDERFPD